jgi:dihydrolipoamide dehydrogenase
MAKHEFDVVVVGGGPGGYVAAIRSSQLGMKTALVEREHLGGICLNWGCIPTKALLRTAEIYALMHHVGDFGLKAKDVGYDFPKVIKRSRQVASQLNRGVQHLMRKNKVQVFDGHGRLDGKKTVAVAKDGKDSESVQAEHIILATGARARTLPGLEPDGKHIWTYKEAMVPEAMPRSVLVIGSGAIGIEFASFYAHLGADVTVVEILDRVLPVEDEEISAFARKQFEKRGFKIHTKAKVSGLAVANDAVQAKIEPEGGQPETITVDRVVLAVGIVGNVEDLGLENTAVEVDGSHVVTDEWLRTGEPGVYAIGDVAGPPWLAHKASHEGVVCVERIKGLNTVHPLDVTKIPGCTYCTPQVASVGLTEKAAKEKGYEVKVGHFPYVANGKAIALGETEGMVKTVFDARTGELLGAHMIGAEVTELIHGYVLARQVEATELDLMHTIYAHPTLSEMMHEAVLDAYGQAIHF